MVRNIPLISCGQLSWLCLLPTSHVLPTFLASMAVQKTQKALAMCKPCSAIAKPNIINSVFGTNPKYSPTLTTVKKTTPDKTSAPLKLSALLLKIGSNNMGN